MVGVLRAGQGRGRDVRGRAGRLDPHGLDRRFGPAPRRSALRGKALDAESIAAAAEQAADGTDPPGDLNATPDYKRAAREGAHPAGAASRREPADAALGSTVPTRSPEALAGERYLRRPRRLPPPSSSPARSSSRCCSRARPGVGKTEVAKALAGRPGRAADPAPVPRGHRPAPRPLRLGLPAPAAGDPGGRGRGRSGRAVHPRVPAAPAAAGGAGARGAGGAADRRGRPGRRRVRGLPARAAVRLPGLDPGAGDRDAPAARPLVVLTSNRTRELHDALKRRCLYHWIDYPSPEREAEIVRVAAARRARRRGGAGLRGRGAAARARTCTSCPAWARRSPGRRRCSRWSDDDARRARSGWCSRCGRTSSGSGSAGCCEGV